jgi:hypothetical protein
VLQNLSKVVEAGIPETLWRLNIALIEGPAVEWVLTKTLSTCPGAIKTNYVSKFIGRISQHIKGQRDCDTLEEGFAKKNDHQ